MDFPIKVEINSDPNCVACLRNDLEIFGEHEMKPEILLAYNDIVKEEINHTISPIELCIECLKKLDEINEFKEKCVKSIRILKTKNVDMVKESIEDIDSFPPIKEEVMIYAEDLKVELTELKEIPKKTNTSKKRSIAKPPQQFSCVSRLTKIVAGYCHICCYEHANSHKHAIHGHSRELENGILKCLLCEENSKDVYELLEHLQMRHKYFEIPKKCAKCNGIETKDREEFARHIRACYYNNQKPAYPCEFCESVFCREFQFRFHNHKHFGALQCRYCHKTFYDKNTYDIHSEAHKQRLESITYVCDLCQRTFKKKNALLNHMIMCHDTTAEAKFQCKQCDKAFKTRFQLTRHVRLTHKESPTQCLHCGQTFKSIKSYKHHVRRKHSENPPPLRKNKKPETRNFACDQCDAKFYVSSTLKKHKFSHSKTRPYVCTLCPTGYYCNEYLRNHYLRNHELVFTAKDIRKMCGLRKPGETFD